jgi:hypothetical protein
MFLDRELRDIEVAKAAVGKRCAMRRLSLQLDILIARARVRGAVSGVKAVLTVAELVMSLFSSHRGRDG